jgi:hypothetical protein
MNENAVNSGGRALSIQTLPGAKAPRMLDKKNLINGVAADRLLNLQFQI